MIYLFTALYDEAYPFLQYYKMKKEINSLPFEMYRCEEQQICLTITGTGEITAATVVAAVCAMGHVKAGDIFVQCGICAGAKLRKKRHKRHFTRIFYTGIRFPKLRL